MSDRTQTDIIHDAARLVWPKGFRQPKKQREQILSPGNNKGRPLNSVRNLQRRINREFKQDRAEAELQALYRAIQAAQQTAAVTPATGGQR